MGDLSEEGILARVLPLLSTPASALVGPGDDCAVVAAPDGRFVVTTDVLVQDRHFRVEWSDGYDIGWRAAVQNLADVVAMGATPTSLVVSLVLPGAVPVPLVEDLARGLADACARVGAGVVGGDLSGGESLVVAVTAHGDLGGREPVLRSGARSGDVVALAGVLGRSAAGLALLDGDVPVQGHQELVEAYLRPDPPLGVDTTGARAMLDVSDGLLRDAARIARASGVGIDLDPSALDRHVEAVEPAARRLVASRGAPAPTEARSTAIAWVLTGGEDHGLLATFPAGTVPPRGFLPIGSVVPPGAVPVTVDGEPPSTVTRGWDHFAR